MAPTTRNMLLSVKSTVTDDEIKYDDEIKCDDKILLLLNKLDQKIDKVHEDIGGKIDQQSLKHSEDVSKKLKKFESNMDDKIQTVSSSHSLQIEKLASVIENNERVSKLYDVILRGIPINPNENLIAIFDQISLAIGFNSKVSTVNNIFRFGNENNATRNPPIIVKFLTVLSQQEFMSKYFTHGKLNLRAIGCDSDSRIYASHNLTKFNFEIQQVAVRMLKEKKIIKIHTRAGLVYVKFKEDSGFVKISHPNDLNLMQGMSDRSE